jgi:hypothetical protein
VEPHGVMSRSGVSVHAVIVLNTRRDTALPGALSVA